MWNALMLRHRPERRAPAVASHPVRGIDGQPFELVHLGTAAALQVVLMQPRAPPSAEIDLSERWCRGRDEDPRGRKADKLPRSLGAHRTVPDHFQPSFG